MNDLNEKTETGQRQMNGWETLHKIVSELVFGAVFIAVLGVIYLLVK
jgi:hypothetical protein